MTDNLPREVRTRFAPSPTGFQHVGGFRTAFFSFLLAKHYGGKFLLRVEDTDKERRVPGAIKYIIEELKWFGIGFDEGPSRAELEQVDETWDGMPDIGGPHGPYIQSLRLAKYHEVAERLIGAGAAYRCDCTPEMLERERLEQMARKELPGYSGYCRGRDVAPDRPHTIRFKMPYKPNVVLEDAVKGRVAWDSLSLRDPVLLKSDRFPTYHLAVVVDDHDMRISHVLRGDEWLASAPLHLLLYQALGWQPPTFAHLPVIMGSDGKKLSKRSGAVSSDLFREQGYLAEALLNFVVLIGWSVGEGEEQEVFSRQELVERFTLERVNKASGVFDINKLGWMNGVYLRKMPPKEFTKLVLPLLEKADLIFNEQRWEKIVAPIQERVKLLNEVPEMVQFLFREEISRDLELIVSKDVDREKAVNILKLSLARLADVEEFSLVQIEPCLRGLATELGMKPGPMFSVLRIAVTGKKISPPLFESFVALGKELTLERIQQTIQLL